MNKAQEGDTVTVTFQGLLEDGSVFDACDESDPLTFVLGNNEVLPGMELAVMGMQEGDQKTVVLPPEQGFGARRPHLVDEVAIAALPRHLALKVGDRLEVEAEDGTAFKLLIIDRSEETITLDANHPLAGRSLTLQIEMVTISRPTLN